MCALGDVRTLHRVLQGSDLVPEVSIQGVECLWVLHIVPCSVCIEYDDNTPTCVDRCVMMFNDGVKLNVMLFEAVFVERAVARLSKDWFAATHTSKLHCHVSLLRRAAHFLPCG